MKNRGLLVPVALSSLLTLAAFATSSEAAEEGAGNVYQKTTPIYVKHCVSCHGRDGRGKTAKGKRTYARDLTDSNWQADVSDERLFNSITNGRGKMPAFGKRIPETMIDELVVYVRNLKR